MKQLNIGVIGLGEIGQVHCEMLSRIERARLVCVADIDESISSKTAAQYNTESYTSYEDMLLHNNLEAVVVAVPDHLHKDPCLSAIAEGKHVLVEKPIATTLEESETIIQAADEAQVKLMVGFTLRFFPQYAHAKQTVIENGLGELVSIFARRTNLLTQPDRINGRTGVMFFLGIHDFDAMRWIVNSEPVSIYCEASTSVASKYPIENETFSIIKFENGVIGCAHIGWYLPETHPTGFDFKLDVTGNKGILNLDMVHQGVAVYGPNGGHYAYMAEPLLEEDRSFVDAVLDNTDVPVTGHDGLVAVRMVLAALESIESKSIVRLESL